MMTAVLATPLAAALEQEWDELADRARDTPPWLRPGWIGAWWCAFGRGRLELITARRDGRLVGLVPLARRGGVLRSTTNFHTPSFGVLAEDADAFDEVVLEALARGARRLELAFLARDGHDARRLRALGRAARCRLVERTLERSPYVDTARPWEAYRTELDGKLLRELRRRRRKLESQGRLELVVEEGSTRLDDLLDDGFRVEAAAWKGANRTAIASDPHTERFYRDVAAWAAARRWLRLAFLRLNGRALAFDFALEKDGRHHLLKTGYDPAFRTLAPGVILRHEMLARAFELGLRSYEFGGRDESWKLEWAWQTRETVLVQAFAPTRAGRVEWSAFAYGRPIARRMLGPLLRRIR